MRALRASSEPFFVQCRLNRSSRIPKILYEFSRKPATPAKYPQSAIESLSGDFVGRVTPVPIPNTEVKPPGADGTARVIPTVGIGSRRDYLNEARESIEFSWAFLITRGLTRPFAFLIAIVLVYRRGSPKPMRSPELLFAVFALQGLFVRLAFRWAVILMKP
jgi:hypothetical protein